MSLGPLSTIVEDKFNGNYNAWVADFAERVKSVYPEWAELHSAIEHNYEIAGLMLDDASYIRYNSGKFFLPKSEQRMLGEKSKLYEEWLYTWRRNGLVVEQTR